MLLSTCSTTCYCWAWVSGGLYYRHALLNMVLAETLSNVHSFIIIATNHCGDDLYRFDSPCKVQRACVQLDYKIVVQLYE